jgi:hypothetical protein
MDGKTEFTPLKGVTATIYDQNGSEIALDAATGLIKTLNFAAALNVTTTITGSATIKWKLQNYDFTKLGADVTVYINGGLHSYEELIDIGTALNAAFKGCAATVYDNAGNRLVFNENGEITEVIAPNGDTLYPVAE